MKNIYELVNQFISGGESVVLACIIDHSGSTPRELGSKMIIRESGRIEGSIGGGLLEALVQKLAAGVFQSRRSIIKEFCLNKEEVAGIGMACGGNVSVYLKYIDSADRETRETFAAAEEIWRERNKAWMITIIEPDGTFRLVLHSESGKASGQLSESDLDAVKAYLDYRSRYIDAGDRKYMVDPLVCSKAFIFGGGHIGYEMAALLERLEFHITVIDDREEFVTKERFPQADRLVVCPFEGALEKLDVDANSYIIIVTRGHMHDQTVLEQALGTDAGYIGMIGSRTKRDASYKSLLEKGFTQSDISRVHSPIGLNIGAHTPAEIAVSIAAEMIQIRAGGQR
jgi:xanthine dehydrogenase accessory factor